MITINNALNDWRLNYGKGGVITKTEDDLYECVYQLIDVMHENKPHLRIIVLSIDKYHRAIYYKMADKKYKSTVVTTNKDDLVPALTETGAIVIVVGWKGCSYIYDIVSVAKFYCFICIDEIGFNRESFYKKGVTLFDWDTPRKGTQIEITVPKRGVTNNSNSKPVYKNSKLTAVELKLSANESGLLDQINKYISDTMGIFGSFENLEKCRNGDSLSNTTAAQYRESIARDNGWRDNLDLRDEYSAIINETYNPNKLCDRIILTYELFRKRKEIIEHSKSKLEYIRTKIECGERIIIVCNGRTFAETIREYIENNIPNTNSVCIYKGMSSVLISGENKKSGYKTLCKRFIPLFNQQRIDVFITTKSLELDCDMYCDCYIETETIKEEKRSFSVSHIKAKQYEQLTISKKNDKIDDDDNFMIFDENN